MSETAFQAFAILLGTFAAGASIGLSFYAIPTAIRTRSQANKSAQLIHIYNIGHASLPLSYVATALTHLGLAWKLSSRLEAAAGALTLAIVPYSIVFMTATDDKMIKVKAKDDEGVVKEVGGAGVLDEVAWRWSKMNVVRSVLALAGAGVSFYGLVN